MVTFICDNCDATLKKKQVKGHQWSCRSHSFTCVDCHKSFPGNEYEAHTSCMTEQEKYWGPYYKGNKQVKTGPQTNVQAANKGKQLQDDVEEKKEEVPLTFNGWKNTLKAILKREENNELNKKELKKKLKEILDNEGYDTEEKTFNQNVDKVLSFRAFKVSGNGLVKYLPPSERPPKKSAAAKQKEAKETGDGKFDWERRLITILKTEPSHKLKVKRVKKKLVEEYLQKFPKAGEEKAEDLFDEITGKMEGIVQDSKFIQWIPSSD